MGKIAKYFKRHPYQQLVFVVLIMWWVILLAWLILELPKVLWARGIRQAGREFRDEVWDFLFTKTTYQLWRV